MDLTDEQWEVLESLIPDPLRRTDGRGRSASPHENTLVEETLAAGFAPGEPERLIGDRAYRL